MHLIRSLWHSPINATQRPKIDTKLLTFSGGKLHQKLEFTHEGDQSQDIPLLKTYASANDLIEGIFNFMSPTTTEAKWS